MKLKTKFQDEDFELGEVVDVAIATRPDGGFTLQGEAKAGGLIAFQYHSLKELYDNWEDYEEPKLFYRITCEGVVVPEQVNSPQQFINDLERIGNYFETREEAEKAVEKLKAITRLESKGFRTTGYDRTVFNGKDCLEIITNIPVEEYSENKKALDLLFSGEEE